MKLFNHVGDIEPIEMSAEMVDGKRVYLTPTGDKFPSVTTVISNNKEKMAGIARWRARVGEAKANANIRSMPLVAAQSTMLLRKIISIIIWT